MTCTWELQKAGVGFVDGLQSDQDCRDQVDRGLIALHKECKFAGLVSICTHIEVVQRIVADRSHIAFPIVISHVQAVLAVLQDSLLKQIVFRFDEENSDLYQNFGLTPVASGAFPSAWRELGHAAHCLSFDQSTASVFHSMRATEFPIRALTATLLLTPSNLNWGNVLNECENAIRGMGPQNGSSWKEDKAFYSEAAVSFRYFKDAWRNRVMHSEVSYEREDAKQTLEHSRSLIEHLATRLAEIK